MNHTPGPWMISHGGRDDSDGFTVMSLNAYSGHVKAVCECWPCSIISHEHRRELAANARLIAAAPRMAELLQDVLDYMEPTEHFRHREYGLEVRAEVVALLAALNGPEQPQ